MNVFSRNGTLIHYHAEMRKPAGKTLVFINSLGTDFRIWDGVREHLKGRFNLVLHDKRGHGLSSRGRDKVSIATYAADIEALLKHVKARNVVLCGLSIGGLIAQQLMLHSKLKIKGAILSNTAAKIGTPERWNARIGAVISGGIEPIADSIMQTWFAPAFFKAHPAQLALCRTMVIRQPQDGYIDACVAIRDNPRYDHAKARKVPVLCIGGESDGSTPPAIVKELAASIKGASYHEFKRAAHLPCIEHPKAYADLITRFAAKL